MWEAPLAVERLPGVACNSHSRSKSFEGFVAYRVVDAAGGDPTIVEVEESAGGDSVEDGGVVPAGLVEGPGVGCRD
jgi:hypothetical protein